MSRLRKLARAVLPRFARTMIRNTVLRHRLWSRYREDAELFWRYSNTNQRQSSRMNLRATLIAQTHCIEKALALSKPRLGFGERQVAELIQTVREYVLRYGADWTSDMALDALSSYSEFHTDGGHVNSELLGQVQQLTETCPRSRPDAAKGATVVYTREELLEARSFDFASFAASRHSIRQFTPEPVDVALIESAVSMALATPSVCNRQAWRVYAFSDPELKTRILSQQTGNRGFGDQIAVLLVVACDLQCFFNASERNQAWADGGMFAMSLLFALHSLGLGACSLNWCTSGKAGPAALACSGIRESDAVVMMIGVGHPPERLRIARSKRKSLDEALIADWAAPSGSRANVVKNEQDRCNDELRVN